MSRPDGGTVGWEFGAWLAVLGVALFLLGYWGGPQVVAWWESLSR